MVPCKPLRTKQVGWPSGLRRWFKAPVISMAWVRIPPLPKVFFFSCHGWILFPNDIIIMMLTEVPFHTCCRVCVGAHSSRTACPHLSHIAWPSGNPECSICQCGSHHCCDLSGEWLRGEGGRREGGNGGMGERRGERKEVGRE